MINQEVKLTGEATRERHWGLFAILSLAILIIFILYIFPAVSDYINKYDVPVTRGPSDGLNINISERPWFLNFWFGLLGEGGVLYFALIPLILAFIALSQKGALNRSLGIIIIVGYLFFGLLYYFRPLVLF